MSNLGGGELRTDFVVDLNSYRQGLADAKGIAQVTGRSIGESVRAGLSVAADAVVVVTGAVRALRSGYSAVSDSVRRLEAQTADDPGVRAFREVEESASSLFDTLVGGVLQSGVVQAGLGRVATVISALSESAAGLGSALDEFIVVHSPKLVALAAPAARGLALMGNAFRFMGSAFRATAGQIDVIAGGILGTIERALSGAAELIELLEPSIARALRGASEKFRGARESIATEGLEELDAVAGEVEAFLMRVATEVEDLAPEVERLLVRLRDAARAAAEAAGSRALGGEGSERRERTARVFLQGLERLSSSAQATIGGMTATLARMFNQLADDAKGAFDVTGRAIAGGVGSALTGLSSLAGQAERAFGRSTSAAKVFTRIQLGLQAAFALVRGTMEAAEALSAEAEGGGRARAAHTAAALAFFAAAGLAGAQAAGLVGPGTTGQGSQLAATEAGEPVARRQTNFTLVVEGNLVDNEEFVQDVLVPEFRRQVEEEDVTFVATHARRADQLGGL